MGTVPLPIPTADWHRNGHPPAFAFGQPDPCPLCRAYYFGCYGRQLGHMTWLPRMRGIGFHATEDVIPWKVRELDGGLCIPSNKHAEARAGWKDILRRQDAKQPQGKALVHHRDGWTALAFWDRTCDSRGNSNSVFILEGTHDFDAALARARSIFPEIFARITFEIVPFEIVPKEGT